MRSLEDLDNARSKSFGKKGGGAAPLTMNEQLLRQRAESVLSRLQKAKLDGDPIAIAKAKLAAERVQAELQSTNASRGSLNEMRSALARSMTDVTVR